MAMTCINGAAECDGCMKCQKDPVIIGHCFNCGEELAEGDDHYDIEGVLLHEDCLHDWAKQYLVRGS